ncbi:MAG TPA: MASE4 domain-containing protein, partial [Skermanella sp.]|nr:MASE4 domain-containing protein [Skermanella sp.]
MNFIKHELPGTFVGESASPWLRRTIALLCVAYALATLAILPFAHLPGPVIPAVTTTFGAGVLIADLCTGFLLLVQFRTAPTWAMLLLSAAYFYSGAMALLHVLTFPGAWIPDGVLIGTFQSVGWLFIAWLLGFPSLVLAAVVSEARRKGRRISPGHVGRATIGVLAAVAGAVIAIAVISLTGDTWLPHELDGNVFALWGSVAQWTSAG